MIRPRSIERCVGTVSLFTLYSGEIVPANFGGPMLLKAEQLWRVATVYDKVAADKMGVPSPQRAAFARKAKRLRMLARIAAKIEAADFVKPTQPLKSRQQGACSTWCASDFGGSPKVKYKTLAERLETARAAASAGVAGKVAPVEERLSHPFCNW